MGFSQFRDGNGMMTFGKTIAEVAVYGCEIKATRFTG
jgi:hypothetical protein